MISVYADLLTKDGRPNKLLIPPSTTRLCRTSVPSAVFIQSMRFELYISPNLAKRSLTLIRTEPFTFTVWEFLLHNGGWENQWIEDGENILNIYEFRD